MTRSLNGATTRPWVDLIIIIIIIIIIIVIIMTSVKCVVGIINRQIV
jgi:uncharacterized protein (DUF983 family)